jgi:hypothetical protein
MADSARLLSLAEPEKVRPTLARLPGNGAPGKICYPLPIYWC